MKKEIAVLAICLIIVGGIFYFGRKDSVSNSQTSTSTPVSNTLKVSPIVSEYASTTYTSVSLNYPKSSEDELSEVFLTVRDIKNDFIKAYGGLTKEDADKMYITSSDPYELVVNTKIQKSEKTITYLLYAYEYTGGAHGGTGVYSFTYDLNNKLLKEKDVFESAYLSVIAPMARDYFYMNLGEYKNPAMIDSGTFPEYENYRTWYLTDDSVVFVFGQYQVGPYVLGIQEFRIDKSKLSSVLKAEYSSAH
jgi:hypothetical protein